MSESSEEKKIIIDEDWKTQVEREREAELDKERREAAGDSPQPDALPELPPASFEFLVSTMVTQILAALGQIADPSSGQPTVQLDFAKHQIDTLEILQEKTRGNLTEPESTMIEQALHELRMLYVTVQTQI